MFETFFHKRQYLPVTAEIVCFYLFIFYSVADIYRIPESYKKIKNHSIYRYSPFSFILEYQTNTIANTVCL